MLKALSEASGISGEEHAVRRLIQSRLPADAPTHVDPLGNLVVWRRPDRRAELVLVAHMDEVGFRVVGHTEDGRLEIRPSGGVDAEVAAGAAVRVGREGHPGVVGVAPPHLADEAERRAPLRATELTVDVGCEGRAEAEALAALGTPVVFATVFREDGEVLSGKALDDRLGCYVLWRLLTDPASRGLPFAAVFSVQEDVGLRGAGVAVRRLRPAAALVVEATPAFDSWEAAGYAAAPAEVLARLGGGPALTVVDARTVGERRLADGLVAAAERVGAPWQWRRGVGGGNDAGAIVPEGVPTQAVSVPCRYIHGPAALARRGDVEATVSLLGAFLTDFAARPGKGDA